MALLCGFSSGKGGNGAGQFRQSPSYERIHNFLADAAAICMVGQTVVMLIKAVFTHKLGQDGEENV